MTQEPLSLGFIGGGEGRAMQTLRRKALDALRREDPAKFETVLQSARSRQGQLDSDLTVLRSPSVDGSAGARLTLANLGADARRELGRLQEASEKLEAVMVKQMLAQMRRSVPQSPLDGPMGDLAKDMLDQAMSEHLAQTGSVGIATMLFDQLSQRLLQQEAARAAQSTAADGADDATNR